MKFILSLFLSLSFIHGLFAQETFPVNGIPNSKSEIYYAFTNATLVTDYKTILPKATLLIRNGLVEQAGANVNIPKGAVIYDLKGKFIYPSFIDAYSDYGMPAVKKEKKDGPQMQRKTAGPLNWNDAVKPETNSTRMFTVNSSTADELRKLGFGTVLTHQQDGIARGTSSVVTLANESENEVMLKSEAAAHYSFNKGVSTQDYPSSLMGSIALLRQTYLDAEWYKQNRKVNSEYNFSLGEFNRIQKLPQVFEVQDKLSALRADKIGDEFKTQYIIKGSGDEYQRINEIKATNASYIIPLNFPDAYDVEDPYDALLVNLEQMKHWELAPRNPAVLEASAVPFAITLHGLKDKSAFKKNIKKALENGFTQEAALKALTHSPAKMLGIENQVGSLKPGMLANFLVTSDSLFSDKNIVYENWVQGKQYILNDINLVDIRGVYDLNVNSNKIYTLKVTGEPQKPIAELWLSDTVKKPVSVILKGRLLSLAYNADSGNVEATRLSGNVNFKSGIWDGKGQLPDGKWVAWSAIKKSAHEETPKKDSAIVNMNVCGDIFCPPMAFGWKMPPAQETILVKNATVWTNEKEGILKNADVLIQDGKIAQVGQNIDISKAKDVKTIDGTDKHLTAGIIDEHSHIAISQGVNEGGQAISSEVSIGDVINSDDINIYRQLAGGVTAAQLLHGSANPIGGQSGLIKLRWGRSPEQMKIENADGFIKFALGENVKQANWGEKNTIRYPQTRMGVEQVFYNAFTRAKEYKAEWEKYNTMPAKERLKLNVPEPRRDLELEALAEILDNKRFITCHSYIQSEINMLMHVADSMNFRVNTFTHILEGYKVADKMKKHGVGASTFSDWWAYKFEVNDAIPYNAALLTEMGVVTAINSDDAEMGRRLNQEAAKTVKYGSVSEEEALKMVTLNPAKLLHLDNRMGSIKPGKDADVVLWSDNPLSVYAKAEKTLIDGVVYFDREKDLQLRNELVSERARLVQKMIIAKKNGDVALKPEMKKARLYHCDSMEEEEEVHGH